MNNKWLYILVGLVVVVAFLVYMYESRLISEPLTRSLGTMDTSISTDEYMLERLNLIESENKRYAVFLEKEYDDAIQRYIRQTVYLIDRQGGEPIVLDELKFSTEDALTRYTEDGCNEDGSDCCNYLIDSNEFQPVRWFGNSLVLIERSSIYECSFLRTKALYNTSGQSLYKLEGLNSVGEVCEKDDRTLVIIDATPPLYNDPTYIEYDMQSGSIVAKKEFKYDPSSTWERKDDFKDFVNNCERILSPDEVDKFFK